MTLIKPKEFQTVLGLRNFGILGRGITKLLMWVFKLSLCNTLYDKYKNLAKFELIDSLLEYLKIEFEVSEEDLERIPKKGAFIVVANHPLGALDGLILIKILGQRRPDIKMISNFLLSNIKPLSDFFFNVNPFENRSEICKSIDGLRGALNHLELGSPVGLFPAGEVSTYINSKKAILDRPWVVSGIKFVQKANVPVIPVYFHAKNSKLFYTLSSISGTLRTALLPRELFRRRNKKIQLRIGVPISVKEQKEHPNTLDLREFLRKKTYVLANVYKNSNPLEKVIEKIVPTKDIEKEKVISEGSKVKLLKEINLLIKNKKHLFTTNEYQVFLASSSEIPNILQEIGRLRELTFREIGEGTNKSIDLDKYDKFYNHLFLWNHNAKQIVGAYRMGMGAEIFPEKGIQGFYLSELFNFEIEIQPFFRKTIEMGRAFVRLEYQQKPLPLFILWKGILHVILRNPQYKFLIGGVSISNQFSDFSKSLMIEFMRSHYYDPYLAQFIRPKKNYKIKLKDADKDFVLDMSKADLNKFDKLISEIEPGNLRLPVLIKKYIKQNAKLIGFNVDPKFNDAVDGLMYIRISEIPKNTFNPVLKDLEEALKKTNDTRS